MVVNAHGCGLIAHTNLSKGSPVKVKMVSNGASKEALVVIAIPIVEATSWLLGLEFETPENFWKVENPPADWRV